MTKHNRFKNSYPTETAFVMLYYTLKSKEWALKKQRTLLITTNF